MRLHSKSVDPKKFANIDEWKAPTTAKQIQLYLGTFNFFREYILLFSIVAAPLDALRSRTDSFTVNDEQLQSFNTLKNLLTYTPVLSFPNFSKPFYVVTDATDVRIDAVLYQLPQGITIRKKPTTFLSWVGLSKKEVENIVLQRKSC